MKQTESLHPYHQVLQWIADGDQIEYYYKGVWYDCAKEYVLNNTKHYGELENYFQPHEFRVKPKNDPIKESTKQLTCSLQADNKMLKDNLQMQVMSYKELTHEFQDEMQSSKDLRSSLEVYRKECICWRSAHKSAVDSLNCELNRSSVLRSVCGNLSEHIKSLAEQLQDQERELKLLQENRDFYQSGLENDVAALRIEQNYSKGLKIEVENLKILNKQQSDTALNIKEKAVKYFKEKQEDFGLLTAKCQDLNKQLIDMTTQYNRLRDISTNNSTSVTQNNLSQSEIDFLKNYLSKCLTENSYRCETLKVDAKFYKNKNPQYSNLCYKDVKKLQKKINVLSGIQHKLKGTVLNRKVKEQEPSVCSESLKQRADSWDTVVDAIEKYIPDFLSKDGTGIECAVSAICTLGESKKQWDKLEGMMLLSLKGTK